VPEPITYSFRWTPEVYKQLTAKRPPASLHVNGKKGQIAVAVGGCLALILMIAAAPIPLGLSDTRGFALTLWGAVAALVGVLLVVFPYVKGARVEADLATRARQGEVRVTLGPDGIESESETGYTRSDWGAVAAVSEAPKATLLWLGALIVMPAPDAALPEGVDRAELLRRVAEWRGAAS
jgi:hypothetical protein